MYSQNQYHLFDDCFDTYKPDPVKIKLFNVSEEFYVTMSHDLKLFLMPSSAIFAAW